MVIYRLYILKKFSGYSMRYGSYETRLEAVNALHELEAINTIDSFYIEPIIMSVDS